MKFSINNPNVTKTNFSFIFLPLKNHAILSHGELLVPLQNCIQLSVNQPIKILTYVMTVSELPY